MLNSTPFTVIVSLLYIPDIPVCSSFRDIRVVIVLLAGTLTASSEQDTFTELLEEPVLEAASLEQSKLSEIFEKPETFSEQLERVLQKVRLPEERMKAVPLLLEDLERILQSRWPGCKAVPFGSIVTGLALTTSDVDCVIVIPKNTDLTFSESPIIETHSILQNYPELFQEFRLVPKALTPILVAKHLPTGFYTDISFKFNGIGNSKLVRYLLSLDERALNLAMIVKLWAKVHGITKKKVLSNFGINHMVIFYLQQNEILPSVVDLQKNAESVYADNWNMGFTETGFEPRNNDTMCSLLGNFFKYYSDFDFANYMISAFVGHPVEISLFEDVSTVPDVFATYKINVSLNLTKAFEIKKVNIQAVFEHWRNFGSRLDAGPDSEFVTQFRYAAMSYKDDCTNFLSTILHPYTF